MWSKTLLWFKYSSRNKEILKDKEKDRWIIITVQLLANYPCLGIHEFFSSWLPLVQILYHLILISKVVQNSFAHGKNSQLLKSPNKHSPPPLRWLFSKKVWYILLSRITKIWIFTICKSRIYLETKSIIQIDDFWIWTQMKIFIDDVSTCPPKFSRILSQDLYRSCLLYYPPETHFRFFRHVWVVWVRVGYFKGGTTNTILPYTIEKTKGKSQIFKKISDRFRWFGFEGGNNITEKMFDFSKGCGKSTFQTLSTAQLQRYITFSIFYSNSKLLKVGVKSNCNFHLDK